MLTVTRNMSTSTIRAPPTSASIEGMFGYSTAVFDDILDLLPPALLCVEDEGNTLGETILIQPDNRSKDGLARRTRQWEAQTGSGSSEKAVRLLQSLWSLPIRGWNQLKN